MNYLATRIRWFRRRRYKSRLARHFRRVQQRTTRYQVFGKFRDEARQRFDSLAKLVHSLDYFRGYYSFIGCPGGADGGANDRVVDVIFGHRPFDATKDFSTHSNNGQPGARLHVEQGASLRYERGDTGRVLVFLYPARTEARRPCEDFILLDEIADPGVLTRDSILRKHLRWLAAYMASTSLDGAITISQRLRVAALWLWFRRYERRRLHQRRTWIGLGWLAKWVATVGLSGLILFFIQAHWPPADSASPAIRKGTERAHIDSVALKREVVALRVEVASIRAAIVKRSQSGASHLSRNVPRQTGGNPAATGKQQLGK